MPPKKVSGRRGKTQSQTEISVSKTKKPSSKVLLESDTSNSHQSNITENKQNENILNGNSESVLKNSLTNTEFSELVQNDSNTTSVSKSKEVSVKKRKFEEEVDTNGEGIVDDDSLKIAKISKNKKQKMSKLALKKNATETYEESAASKFELDDIKEDKILKVSINRDEDIEKLILEEKEKHLNVNKYDKPIAKGKRGRPKKTDFKDDAKLLKIPKVTESDDEHSIQDKIPDVAVLENEKSDDMPVQKGKRGRTKKIYFKDFFDKSANVPINTESDEKSEENKIPDVTSSVNKKGDVKPAQKGKRGRAIETDSKDDGAKSPKVPKKTVSKGQSKKDKMPDVTLLDFNNASKSPSNKPWNLKLSSWNVNGIRAWLEKDGLSYVKHEAPDIMCVQETKCSDEKLPEEVNISGYHCYWLAGDQEGYSGVGLLSKIEPISVKYGIDLEEHDKEGRVITAEYENFFLVTTYVPNAGRKLVRLDYRMQWDKDFRAYLKKLEAKKPIILCGDLNVAHEEIDLANPKTNKKNAGFTQEEREGFSTLLKEGFIDTFRHLYPERKNAYTFWTYMMNARAKDVGWRLDYFVISESFVDHLCDSVIRKEVMGSDHCPIVLFLSV